MIERLQHIFASSSHTYGGLTLDFHYNRLGPAALFQVFTIPETYLSKWNNMILLSSHWDFGLNSPFSSCTFVTRPSPSLTSLGTTTVPTRSTPTSTAAGPPRVPSAPTAGASRLGVVEALHVLRARVLQKWLFLPLLPRRARGRRCGAGDGWDMSKLHVLIGFRLFEKMYLYWNKIIENNQTITELSNIWKGNCIDLQLCSLSYRLSSLLAQRKLTWSLVRSNHR
jgi:hypothetical protein